MFITYNNKEIEMKFNLFAITQLDKELGIEMDGMSFGEGLSTIAIGLESGNPVKLAQIIKSCTAYDPKAPKTMDQLEIVLNDIAEGIGFDEFGKQVAQELGKRPMTQKFVDKKYHQKKATK